MPAPRRRGDVSRFRSEFPIVNRWAYLDSAAYGPHPVRYRDAVSSAAGALMEEPYDVVVQEVQRVRDLAATLLQAPERNVALLRSTGEGANLVAQGLDWSPGDEVILYELDFPSLLTPFLALVERGVVVRPIADRARDRFDLDDLERLITPRTRAIAISLVNPYHGFRAPVEEIGALCRARGIWFVVDAVQALGVAPLDVPSLGADVVAAHAYKFLLGGFGYALAYCSDRSIEELHVPHIGATSLRWDRPNASSFVGPTLLKTGIRLRDGARRFEPAVGSVPALMGLGATLELLCEATPESVAEHVAAIANRLADGLRAQGFEVPNRDGPQCSSLVVASSRERDAHAAQELLAAAGIRCAVRRDRLRFSPHLFNTLDEADAVTEALKPRRSRRPRSSKKGRGSV